jgi:hypothetical protein
VSIPNAEPESVQLLLLDPTALFAPMMPHAWPLPPSQTLPCTAEPPQTVNPSEHASPRPALVPSQTPLPSITALLSLKTVLEVSALPAQLASWAKTPHADLAPMEPAPQVSALLPMPPCQPPLELALHVSGLPQLLIQSPQPHQTAPSPPTTALKSPEPPVTTALLLLAPAPDATPSRLATPTTLVLASPLPALLRILAPPRFARSCPQQPPESALNATLPLAQEMNAPLPKTMIQLTFAPPVFAVLSKTLEFQEEVSQESSSDLLYSSEQLLDSPYTAARRTTNLTMLCKKPSNEQLAFSKTSILTQTR